MSTIRADQPGSRRTEDTTEHRFAELSALHNLVSEGIVIVCHNIQGIDDMANKLSRRDFVAGSAAAGMLMSGSPGLTATRSRRRVALVGTGVRGMRIWGEYLQQDYSDVIEYVALCDINPGRVELARKRINADCPTFTNFDEMLATVNIDTLIVCTVDATHDEFIVKGLAQNLDVITEKPMVTDEHKCQSVIDAARKSKGELIVGLNYRYGILFTRLKELLAEPQVGRLTSVDFHWYLNIHHGASYFRRWHGLREHSGTLLVHKAAHHFDLLNWWIDSDPVEVHAYGALEKYGANNSFRGRRCMDCPHTGKCQFYWDMSKDEGMMQLYHANEQYDGYIRDNCLWREEIDIFDKMAVQIRYANDVQVSYSLTTYSPYEGFRIAFNGMNGRVETWEGVPSMTAGQEEETPANALERDQHGNTHSELEYHEIIKHRNFADFERENLPYIRAGHWGGDRIMFDQIFRRETKNPHLKQQAGVHNAVMSVLIGFAARKSIDEGRTVRIAELSDIRPQEKR